MLLRFHFNERQCIIENTTGLYKIAERYIPQKGESIHNFLLSVKTLFIEKLTLLFGTGFAPSSLHHRHSVAKVRFYSVLQSRYPFCATVLNSKNKKLYNADIVSTACSNNFIFINLFESLIFPFLFSPARHCTLSTNLKKGFRFFPEPHWIGTHV